MGIPDRQYEGIYAWDSSVSRDDDSAGGAAIDRRVWYGRGYLLDPYCGTGTTLLEGMFANLDAIGTDLNPLARLIARTKTAPIDLDLLDREIKDFSEFGLVTAGSRDGQTVRPDIPNIDYWFSRTYNVNWV